MLRAEALVVIPTAVHGIVLYLAACHAGGQTLFLGPLGSLNNDPRGPHSFASSVIDPALHSCSNSLFDCIRSVQSKRYYLPS